MTPSTASASLLHLTSNSVALPRGDLGIVPRHHRAWRRNGPPILELRCDEACLALAAEERLREDRPA
ncbi:hypothetical protein ColTof3_13093 [Colletotrichum tofieldiae]|nr:hypothetical protein ColTof3_13093 [Colletotrichum tofieldiae]